MSCGLDREDNDRTEKPETQSRMSLSQGRAGGDAEADDDRADRPQGSDVAQSESRQLTHEREEVRYGRHRYEWSETERAKRLAQHHRLAPEGQALYSGFVKPAEISHDASIYKMYEAEAAQIEAAGDRVGRVVLDFEFKKKIYGDLS